MEWVLSRIQVNKKIKIVVSFETLSHWNFQFLPISLALYTGAKKLGAGVNSLVTPHIYSITGDLRLVFWIGLGAAALCLVIDIIFALFELHITKQQTQSSSGPVDIAGILRFPSIFWFLILYMGLFFGSFIAFFITASGMVQTRFGFTVNEAGLALVTLSVTLVQHATFRRGGQHVLRLPHQLRQTLQSLL
eukprot:TRINITY_DN608_c0_g1_i19.p1 TRINITY_DN608_c0_g1~~TRINITY_DN608_c0_g1_i19.p1  ORF type:complete len:191 (-),score=13.28 TRINITY_DN608_c0_g1_i19:549-1121(-)